MKKLLVILVLAGSFSAFAEDGLKNESELGVIVASGNSKIQAMNAKQSSIYGFSGNVLKGTAGYLRSKTNGVENANAWNLGLRYERALTESFNIFVAQSVDGDKFQKIRQRYNTDVGGKYSLVKTDDLAWFAEAGYRYTKENRTDDRRNYSSLRAYTEAEKKWSATVSTKYWLEYLPNLSESDDYQLNTELSLNAALSSIFSVKTAYLVKFDNEPATGVSYKSDRLFTTALVAKF